MPLPNQGTDTFQKVFEIGLKKFLNPPKTILTEMDPAILKAVGISLKNLSYHVYCTRHCKENVEKHIAGLINPNCFPEISAEDKIKMDTKIIGLFNRSSREKADRDIEYLKASLPESEIKKYFLHLL